MGRPAPLSTLRGTLPAAGPGARGVERLGRNPACLRLLAITLAGTTPAHVAAAVYQDLHTDEQSPFAFATGHRFEAQLFARGAARLLDLYRQHKRLGPRDVKIQIMPDLVPGIDAVALAQRRKRTMQLLDAKLRGDPRAPNIIIKPRLALTLLGVPYEIEPDAMVAAESDLFYRPIEVKSYADRDGKTDSAALRGACRQAAVSVLGLRTALAELGEPTPERLVPDLCDLVLRKPGSAHATLRPMTLKHEVSSLERVFAAVPHRAVEIAQMVASVAPAATLADASTLDALPANYQPSCREHCALAAQCKREAYRASSPILLGRHAFEELAPAGSLQRALDLLNGQGGPPRTPAEQHLAERLRAADRARQEAV